MTTPSEGISQGDPKVDSLAAFVGAVKHLPLFSGTAMQVIRSIDRENVTVGELSRLISTDAALVAHLLRIVNSSYYALSRPIGKVSDALSVLGVDLIRRTVTADGMRRPLFAYLRHDPGVAHAFWHHGLLSAALARHLAIRKGLDGELAYLAGLMHDVGRLAMLMQFPHESEVLLRARSDDDLGTQHELSRFGFDHAQVGGALLELWGLPEKIVQAAHQHADETEPEDAMSASVWLANRLSHEMIDEPEDQDTMSPWMIDIGLSVGARRQILDEIRALESELT